MKSILKNLFLYSTIFIIISGWLFSGWPQIWENPSFPPETEIALADIETRRPTAYTDTAGKTTNPTNAYDADGGTFSTTDYGANAADSINFNTWETTVETYTNTYIKVRYHADAGVDDQYAIAYSTTGCAGSFTYLVNLTSAGAGDTTVSSVDLGDISSGLSSVCVKIETNKSKGPDGSNVYIRDVWTEGTYTPAAVSISLTTDGSVNFGYIELNASQDNTASGINDVEVVSVDTGPANLEIKSTNFTEGVNTWTLGASNGSNQVKWEYASSTTNWLTFSVADTYYGFDLNVAQSQTRDINLRITMPTVTDSYSQYSSTITIQASEP